MHLTVLEFTSILPVPFPEIQILIIIDKNMVLFFIANRFKRIPSRIHIATGLTTTRPRSLYRNLLWNLRQLFPAKDRLR